VPFRPTLQLRFIVSKDTVIDAIKQRERHKDEEGRKERIEAIMTVMDGRVWKTEDLERKRRKMCGRRRKHEGWNNEDEEEETRTAESGHRPLSVCVYM
jgi:hypothetical protein